jgi:glutathionylspermidine synthase
MERKAMTPRPNWRERCEEVGFVYHSLHDYWQENRCYVFTAAEIDKLEAATSELHQLCLGLAGDIVKGGDYSAYKFPPEVCALVEQSWRRDRHLHGRFDLAYDGKDIKLIEYNADTPTALLEAAVVQWNWLEDLKLPDQFNSIHEKLIERWKVLREDLPVSLRLYFTALRVESPEDECHINYLMDTAVQAGIDCSSIDLEQIGWDGFAFTDVDDDRIIACFKLYPWEFLVRDEFAKNLPCATQFIEPAWKMLLSNKTILPLLWKKHPNHPLLLEAEFEGPLNSGPGPITGWVRKPALAREGENATIFAPEGAITSPFSNIEYDKNYIYQRRANVPCLDGYYPIIGSWVIGDDPAGIGIREDKNPITNNRSHFVPHYFK